MLEQDQEIIEPANKKTTKVSALRARFENITTANQPSSATQPTLEISIDAVQNINIMENDAFNPYFDNFFKQKKIELLNLLSRPESLLSDANGYRKRILKSLCKRKIEAIELTSTTVAGLIKAFEEMIQIAQQYRQFNLAVDLYKKNHSPLPPSLEKVTLKNGAKLLFSAENKALNNAILQDITAAASEIILSEDQTSTRMLEKIEHLEALFENFIAHIKQTKDNLDVDGITKTVLADYTIKKITNKKRHKKQYLISLVKQLIENKDSTQEDVANLIYNALYLNAQLEAGIGLDIELVKENRILIVDYLLRPHNLKEFPQGYNQTSKLHQRLKAIYELNKYSHKKISNEFPSLRERLIIRYFEEGFSKMPADLGQDIRVALRKYFDNDTRLTLPPYFNGEIPDILGYLNRVICNAAFKHADIMSKNEIQKLKTEKQYASQRKSRVINYTTQQGATRYILAALPSQDTIFIPSEQSPVLVKTPFVTTKESWQALILAPTNIHLEVTFKNEGLIIEQAWKNYFNLQKMDDTAKAREQSNNEKICNYLSENAPKAFEIIPNNVAATLSKVCRIFSKFPQEELAPEIIDYINNAHDGYKVVLYSTIRNRVPATTTTDKLFLLISDQLPQKEKQDDYIADNRFEELDSWLRGLLELAFSKLIMQNGNDLREEIRLAIGDELLKICYEQFGKNTVISSLLAGYTEVLGGYPSQQISMFSENDAFIYGILNNYFNRIHLYALMKYPALIDLQLAIKKLIFSHKALQDKHPELSNHQNIISNLKNLSELLNKINITLTATTYIEPDKISMVFTDAKAALIELEFPTKINTDFKDFIKQAKDTLAADHNRAWLTKNSLEFKKNKPSSSYYTLPDKFTRSFEEHIFKHVANHKKTFYDLKNALEYISKVYQDMNIDNPIDDYANFQQMFDTYIIGTDDFANQASFVASQTMREYLLAIQKFLTVLPVSTSATEQYEKFFEFFSGLLNPWLTENIRLLEKDKFTCAYLPLPKELINAFKHYAELGQISYNLPSSSSNLLAKFSILRKAKQPESAKDENIDWNKIIEKVEENFDEFTQFDDEESDKNTGNYFF